MMTFVLAFLLAAVPPSRPASPPPPSSQPAAAPQLSDEELQNRIDAFLGAIDTRISPEEWRALGPRGTALLERIAQDTSVLPSKRAAAVTGLSAIGSPTSARVLLNLARSEQESLTVRLVAVHGTPGVLPTAQLGRALKPVLETAGNPQVRRAAADVLSRHGGCSMIRAQASREDDPERMQRALERCNQQ